MDSVQGDVGASVQCKERAVSEGHALNTSGEMPKALNAGEKTVIGARV